jgi:UDP-glucuronate 4-epimerase
MRVLVTGGAGFIGSHVCHALLTRGDAVRVLDNLDPFYSPRIKRANLERLVESGGDLDVRQADIRDPQAVASAIDGIDAIIHLAALAGVRPSIERPADYWDVNLTGTQRILDAIQHRPEVRIVFGSSSSVYGGNEKVPFSEDDPVDRPVSPYAATKRAGELCCWTFHDLYGHAVSSLRFFTVYGPRQRPEMAIHKFARMIMRGEPIPMFGDGSTSRDYTFVADIVQGVVAALDRCGQGSHGGFRIYNLGGAATTTLRELIDMIAAALGQPAQIKQLPEQKGDVKLTYADVRRSHEELGYSPRVAIYDGIQRFIDWYVPARAGGEVE